MKTLIITIAVLMGLASCSNVSSKNSQVVTEVSYIQTGNDTIINFENETVGKLPSGFTADATNKARKHQMEHCKRQWQQCSCSTINQFGQ
jgi:hypothetical protein